MATVNEGPPPSRRTDREYEEELRKLRDNLLRMAGRVEQMIASSVRALMERDTALAKATIEEDWKVNRAEVETDEHCLIILARRQPMASDLRFITLALKMVTDLERIGDLAVNICERVFDIANGPPFVIHQDIPTMTQIVQSMVSESIDAFVNSDAVRAQAAIERDNEVDDLYHRVFRDVLALMTRDPQQVENCIHVQSVAKWLERMGDHATNLAELVVFMVKGKDIRHMGQRPEV